jgi:YVTN family beta-propeller protein
VTIAGEDKVVAIDTATNQLIGGAIPVGQSPYGIAISPDGTRALVTNSGDDDVSVIDLGTGQVLATVDVGLDPYGIAYMPDGSRAFVANNDSSSLTVLDGHSGQPIGGPIGVGLDPSGVAVSPNGLRAYVANYGDGTMSVVDTQTNTVVSTVPGPEEVEWPAITPDGTRGFLSSYEAQGILPFGTSPDPTSLGAPIVTSTDAAQVAIVPNQGPTATFTHSRIRPSVIGTLDASTSSDVDGSIVSYAWNFADGATTATAAPTVSHKFAKPGSYTVQLTVADNEGCSTNFAFTGQTASCNGGPLATVALPVEVAYPGVKVRCPKKAESRCTIALFAVKLGHKRGKATVKIQSKPVRARLKPGASRIVSIKPKAKFAKKLAKAKKIKVLQATKIGGEITVRLRQLRVVR